MLKDTNTEYYQSGIPDQIDSINIELHVLPPFNKKHAVSLLQCLGRQNFNVHTAINEMNYEYYDLVQRFGLKSGYTFSKNNRLQVVRASMHSI